MANNAKLRIGTVNVNRNKTPMFRPYPSHIYAPVLLIKKCTLKSHVLYKKYTCQHKVSLFHTITLSEVYIICICDVVLVLCLSMLSLTVVLCVLGKVFSV